MNRYLRLAAAVSWTALLCLPLIAGVKFQNIDVVKARDLMDDGRTLIFDVRTPEEYAEGHVPGALSIPVGQLVLRSNDLPSDKTAAIIVYCTVGVRSAKAGRILSKMGYSNVFNMKGGIDEWARRRLPLAK